MFLTRFAENLMKNDGLEVGAELTLAAIILKVGHGLGQRQQCFLNDFIAVRRLQALPLGKPANQSAVAVTELLPRRGVGARGDPRQKCRVRHTLRIHILQYTSNGTIEKWLDSRRFCQISESLA